MFKKHVTRFAKSIFIIGCLAAPSLGWSKEYYLDANNGNDAADGASDRPWKSLQKATTVAKGGDVVVFRTGFYGNFTTSGNTPLFDNWVVFRAATGHTPSIGSFIVKVSGDKKPLNLELNGINIKNGINLQNVKNLRIKNNTIEVPGPWTGSNENIEKNAVWIRASSEVELEGVDITRTAIGVTLYQTDNISIRKSKIHDITHDGIRVIGTRNTLIENNHIYGLTDGVTDAEATWSRHCDAIHIYIAGASNADLLRPNDGVIIRGNTLHDVEAQLIQFNNIAQFNEPYQWNRNVLFEHNVFGPSVAPMAFNNAEPVNGLIIRHNTFLNYESKYTSPYAEVKTKTLTSKFSSMRTNENTRSLQIYNNIFHSAPDIAGEPDIFDHNIIQAPQNNPALPRNTQVLATGEIFELPINLLTNGTLKSKRKIASFAYDSTDKLAPQLSCGAFDGIKQYPLDIAVSDISSYIKQILINSRPNIKSVYSLLDSNRITELSARISETNENETVTLHEDFEDADLELAPEIRADNKLGFKWLSQDPSESQFALEMSSVYNRNMLHTPLMPDGKPNFLLVDLEIDWSQFILSFDAMSTYVTKDSGAVFFYLDKSNYYFIDIGTSSGQLVRVMNGAKEVLAESPSIRALQKEMSSYRIVVSRTDKGIVFEVDSDDNILPNLKFVDTNKTAFAKFISGKVGFMHAAEDKYYRMNYDDVRITQKMQPKPPTQLQYEVKKTSN